MTLIKRNLYFQLWFVFRQYENVKQQERNKRKRRVGTFHLKNVRLFLEGNS